MAGRERKSCPNIPNMHLVPKTFVGEALGGGLTAPNSPIELLGQGGASNIKDDFITKNVARRPSRLADDLPRVLLIRKDSRAPTL